MTMLADPAVFLQGILFLALLFAVSVWDIRYRKIPDILQAGIAALMFLDFSPEYLAGILCMVPYLAVALCCGRDDGIGGGDVKLAGSTGLVLGLPASLMASIIGLMGFTLFGTITLVWKRIRGKSACSSFPVGPFLAIGCICAYLIKMRGIIR